MTAVSAGLPYVRVPVLSKMSVRQEAICSKIPGFLIMIPRRADNEIAPTIAVGIPSNSGHGVAITTTAKKQCAPALKNPAPPATARASGGYHGPTLSPSL